MVNYPTISVFVALVALLLGACATPDLNENASVVQRENQRSKLLLSDYRDAGVFYSSAEFDHVVDKIFTRLYPRRSARFGVRIARLPEDNAFALPTNVIVIHLGLLASLENEDQLAFVLAHEVAHIDASHGYLSAHKRRYSRIAAHMTDILSFGSGASYGHFATKLSNASRQQERQADQVAAIVTQRAGYDLSHAADFFDLLQNQPKIDSAPVTVRTHPAHSERRDRVNAFKLGDRNLPAEQDAIPTESALVYQRFRQSILPMSIKDRIADLSFVSALTQIRSLEAVGGSMTDVLCLRGDAFVGIAQTDAASHLAVVTSHFSSASDQTTGVPVVYDEKAEPYYFYRRAQQEYLAALNLEPEASCALKGAGISAYALGSEALARRYLTKYSELYASAKDIRYVRYMLSELPVEQEHCQAAEQGTCL